MRYLSFVFTSVFLLQTASFGQAAGKAPVPDRAMESSYGDIKQERVLQFAEMIRNNVEDDLKNYSKISYAKYGAYRDTLDKWTNYAFLELDSEIDISWFRKLQIYVDFCHNIKKEYDLSPFKKEVAQKVANKKKFEAGLENFKKFLERTPPKPPAQRLEILKRQKQEYLRAKKAQEKKPDGAGRKLFDDN